MEAPPNGEVNSLDELIGSIEELPTLPVVVTKINSMTSNPQTNASDIGRVISNDPSLSSKILRLVNSAYYGFPRKISSVTKAIVLLGFNKVKNMALSASVVDAFKKSTPLDGFSFYEFWQHSVATGICAEVLARHLQPQLADDAFVGGLFHDLGRVVVVNFVPQAPEVFAEAKSSACPFLTASEKVLGIDHARVGSLLAEHWNFPETLVRTISLWPHPEKAQQYRELAAYVHIANVLTSACGFTAPGDHALPRLSRGLLDELRLTPDQMEKVCRETLQGYDNAAAFLELAK